MKLFSSALVFAVTALYFSVTVAVERVEHPGKYDLIYYGLEQQNPPITKVKAHDKYFWVYDGVISPTAHSMQLLENSEILPGETVLDIGTGSGIQAIFAADKASRIVATDLDAKAVENAKYNVARHGVDHIVEVRQGDLFAPIKDNEKFDVILFNVAYPYNNQTQYLWKVHERFFKEVAKYLKPNGRIYYQTGYIANIPRTQAMVQENKLRIMHMTMAAALKYNREPMVLLIQPDPLLKTK